MCKIRGRVNTCITAINSFILTILWVSFLWKTLLLLKQCWTPKKFLLKICYVLPSQAYLWPQIFVHFIKVNGDNVSSIMQKRVVLTMRISCAKLQLWHFNVFFGKWFLNFWHYLWDMLQIICWLVAHRLSEV